MSERGRLICLSAALIATVAVLSCAVIGADRSSTCRSATVAQDRCVTDGLSERTREAFRKMDRQIQEGTRRPVSDVIAADEADPMSDSEFDDALWLALLGRIHSAADLARYPPGVRMYFATTMVESEIGNGGFEQVFENGVDEYFPDAKAGYLLLGDPASAQLLDRATAAAGDPAALDALDESLNGPPWNGVPWSDSKRIAYVRAHRDEFRLPKP